ncbi:MAG TPA: hypothetical protein VH599_15405 [Ktedonobacterales bacterium]
MKSKTTRRFRELLDALPQEAQQQAREAHRLFRANPSSLHFKPLNSKHPLSSVRIGIHYHALAYRKPDHLLWFWIGTHAEYDKIIARF